MNDGRTEPATPKRKREARRQGRSARSVELPQALSLVATATLLPTVLPRLTRALSNDWQLALGRAAAADTGAATQLVGRSFADAAVALLPLVAAIAGAAVAANVAVAGGRPNPFLLKPKLARVSPKAGVKRLVARQQLWELARNAGKLTLLAVVTAGVWRAGLARLLAGPAGLGGSLAIVGTSVATLVRRVAMLALAIGIADGVLARRRHGKSLRMTKPEVKEEHKQTEGNPQAKGAIRRRQMKLSRIRMIAAVARADVVLTNPTHLAVALAYEPGAAAPVVVAKGAGTIAERIKAEARTHGVPVLENKPLARAIFRGADIGDTIPVALYRAVAEVLALVYRTRRRRAA